MIISSGTAAMSSGRQYSSKVQQQRTTFSWTNGNSRLRQVSSSSYESAYASDESYSGQYSYASSGRAPAHGLPSSMYNRYGQDSGVNVRLVSFASQPDPEQVNFRANEDVLMMTFSRLVDMIRNAQFKMNVFGNNLWEDLTIGRTSSSVLSLTSSSSPTVWNRLETGTYSYEENENVSYSAAGSVTTADGRSIDFNVTMQMSRSFQESGQFEQFSQYQQILTDPLVFNLDSSPTAITDRTFFFDIDCDGKKEEISELAKGNGYLALDRNSDGIINDGSELFGPVTGNGFAELSRYDRDHNGWIDEADEIYDKLRIWTCDADGNERLMTLKEADIGAINTGSSRTSFALKNERNELRAQVRATGMFLRESTGEAGTIQQVDFAG